MTSSLLELLVAAKNYQTYNRGRRRLFSKKYLSSNIIKVSNKFE